MAERMQLLKEAMVKMGYKCAYRNRRNMTSYFATRARNGDIRFGIGARDGRIYIVRFSRIDNPRNGTETIVSNDLNAENIAVFIEMLARCAMLRTA